MSYVNAPVPRAIGDLSGLAYPIHRSMWHQQLTKHGGLPPSFFYGDWRRLAQEEDVTRLVAYCGDTAEILYKYHENRGARTAILRMRPNPGESLRPLPLAAMDMSWGEHFVCLATDADETWRVDDPLLPLGPVEQPYPTIDEYLTCMFGDTWRQMVNCAVGDLRIIPSE